MNTKTYMQKPAEVSREWQLIDATDQILGKLATQLATQLIGKDKPTYTPHVDGGDYVVVINAEKVAVTGPKLERKLYRRHSGYAGNMKTETLGELLQRDPAQVITKAVFNMLPKNKLRSDRMNRLKVYAGTDHPHQAQLGGASTSEKKDEN